MGKSIINRECEIRRELSIEIANKCSLEYGKEIIVVGSVSRGLSDERSDIEIEFLVDKLKLQEDMISWIKKIGGTDIFPYGAPLWDGSIWIIFKYKNYWIEAGWQNIDSMISNIDLITDGKAYTHEKLVLASTIRDAICIRNSGILNDLQKKLDSYPDHIQKEIIINTIKPWTIDLAIEARKMLACRQDKMPLLERLIPDIQKVLRILYAVNKEWEPDWKWTKHIVNNLNIKPQNLQEKIDSILSIKNANQSLDCCFDLIKETLLLIPNELQLDDMIKKIINNIGNLK